MPRVGHGPPSRASVPVSSAASRRASPTRSLNCDENRRENSIQGSYSNQEIKFQYIPVWIELNFQDISDGVYHTRLEMNMIITHTFQFMG